MRESKNTSKMLEKLRQAGTRAHFLFSKFTRVSQSQLKKLWFEQHEQIYFQLNLGLFLC